MGTVETDRVAVEYSERLRAALGNRIRDIILFGSRARGEQKRYSDYDFLIVVDRRDRLLLDVIVEIEVSILDEHEQLIGSIVYESEEWERKKNFPLGMNICADGIPL